MVLLDNQKFVTEVSALFQSTREKGSVNITHKRSAFLPSPRPFLTRVPVFEARDLLTASHAVVSVPKPKNDDDATAATAEPDEDGSRKRHEVMVRARTEKKKLSTVVAGKDLVKFQASLAAVVKMHASNLKKKERVKKDAKKEKAAK